MALPPLNTNDEVTAALWNLVQALAEGAMRGTSNLSELTDKALARAALELATVAASGDYSDLANLLIEQADDTGDGLLFVDAGGTVMGYWDGATFAVDGTLSPDILDAGEILIAAEGLIIVDAGYTVIAVIGPDGIRFDAASTLQDATLEGVTTVAGNEAEASDDGGGLVIVDEGYTVIAAFTEDGVPESEAPPTHSDDEIEHRDAGNKAAAAAMAVQLDGFVARPVWKYNQVITYGQSLSAGAEGVPTLSRAAKYGSKMLGTKTTSVSNSDPGANNATPPTWQITGSGINDLVATDGVSAETVLHGAANTYRRLTLAHRGVSTDTDHLLVCNGAAIGGLSISALKSGASPNYWNRVPSLMAQAHSAATAASGTFGVVGVLWLQGEANMTTAKATYRADLDTIIADSKAAAITESGQADPPAFFTYQTTAANTNFDSADLGVQMAQLEAALTTTGVFMVGPNYPYPDSNNLHLPSNSYRWLGSQFGKVKFRVLTLGHRWKPLHMRRATRRGREILIDFHVPHPPLVFENPWLQDGWTSASVATGQTNTQYAAADKGFTIRNTTAAAFLTASSVALASDTQVLITLDKEPPASNTLVIRYADGRHNGHGCVRDSDPTLADDAWEHVTSRTDADTNAALLGARYPLYNWAVAQQITAENI